MLLPKVMNVNISSGYMINNVIGIITSAIITDMNLFFIKAGFLNNKVFYYFGSKIADTISNKKYINVVKMITSNMMPIARKKIFLLLHRANFFWMF